MKKKLTRMIQEFISCHDTEGLYRTPITGFASVGNAKFSELKKTAGKEHFLPWDLLSRAKSVMAYFIPFSERLVKSNIGGKFASREWAYSYIKTNQLISELNSLLWRELAESGYRAAVIPATHNFDKKSLISRWSHRHIAFICGLGSFGINNMLITESGCCGRLGSIVSNMPVGEESHHTEEACLFKINGSCGVCVKKCTPGALDTSGFNRFSCYEICLENAEYHNSIGFADVCGKCLVGLPCSLRNPVKA